MKLTSDQVKQYFEQGFLVIPDFVPHDEIDGLQSQMAKLIKEFDVDATIKSVFTTKEQQRITNKYFLESSDSIRFFFEPDAIKDEKLVVEKDVAFNKVGHALHDLDPVFEHFSYHQRIKDLIKSLGVYNHPLSVQSMYIFKNPKIGGEVGIHQDSTFLHTTPLTTHAIWFAFEDSTIENGCLRALSGSHKNGTKRRFIINEENETGVFVPPERDDSIYDRNEFAALQCKKGSIVLLDGAVVHYSEPNTSAKSRHAYTLHFIEGDGSAVYEKDNWLQRNNPALPFRELY
ncbi:hypothetical protein SAMD00019534_075710, partial [Acytostelium subglobosum LB1]|uniref:hypothetical protein n=1 Tax=Acytostelium subglobosum LB1 TaxID=1410327 RepID=UPI0006450B8F